MGETVIVGMLSLLGTLCGSLAGVLVANKLVNYRLQQLEIKVDKHNGVIDRMYCAEKEIGIIKEQVLVANHRIDDLEKGD